LAVNKPFRIVYFGTPEFAVPSLIRLIDSRHQVVAIVSQPDRPKGRGNRIQPTPTKVVAADRGIPVLQPERIRDPHFLETATALQPDLGVVAAYGKILPDALLTIPRLGLINVHASLLPAYRGAAPVHRAVIAGECETGVTIMRIVRQLDAGPMFASRRRPIAPDETSADVEKALAEIGATLLLDVVEQIADGRAVEVPQDDARATFAPKLTKAEGIIDWSLPAKAIHDRVRGLHPWPLAATRLGNTRLLIHRTERAGPTTPQEAAPPGAIVHSEREALVVMCGDASLLRVVEIQPEGRRAMSARDFLAGHHVRSGERFENP
jgi:methionyl-tRNA formyltransferase